MARDNFSSKNRRGSAAQATAIPGRVILAREMKVEDLIASFEPEKREIIERIFAYYCSFGDPMNS